MSAAEEFVATLQTRHEAGERLGIAAIKRDYRAFCEEHDAFPNEDKLTAAMAGAGWETKRDERGYRVRPEGAKAGDGIPAFVKEWVALRSCRYEDTPEGLTDAGRIAFHWAKAPVAAVYREMAEACVTAGVTPPGPKAFSQYLMSEGYSQERDEQARYWLGITRHPSRENAIASVRVESFGWSRQVKEYMTRVEDEIGYLLGYQYEEKVYDAFQAAVQAHLTEHGLACDFGAPCAHDAMAGFVRLADRIPVPDDGTFCMFFSEETPEEQSRIRREEMDLIIKARAGLPADEEDDPEDE